MNEQQKAQVQAMIETARRSLADAVPDEKLRDVANLLCLVKTAGDAIEAGLDRAINGDRAGFIAVASAADALAGGLISAAAYLTMAYNLRSFDVTAAVDKMLDSSAESTRKINAYINTVRGGIPPAPANDARHAPGGDSIN